jgi:DNA-binding response OmpR family regulator
VWVRHTAKPVCVRYENRVNAQRVLIVDDEAEVRELVRRLLERAGYAVLEAADGRTGLRSLFAERPDGVILDVTMPGLDGWQTLERIRDVSDVPVLMLTAHGGELDRVRGLKGGADDYVAKPFGRHELVARVEALLRRSRDAAGAPETYDDGVLRIDHEAREVTVSGEHAPLTPLEFRLLSVLVDHRSQVLSRQQLLELVWGGTRGVLEDQVRLYVSYVRKKLGPAGAAVETVRGFGYRYRPPGAS